MRTPFRHAASTFGPALVFVALVAAPIAVFARQEAAAAASPDLSGYWELRHDSFSVPRATLTREAPAGEEKAAQHDLDAIQRCIPMGVPALMSDRPVLNLQQSKTVVGIIPKGPASVRYIYTDGRPHPPAEEWEGATNGHSIGHWEGDTLVVDTTGFNERGVTTIPGGGWRTSSSKLTERFHLLSSVQRPGAFGDIDLDGSKDLPEATHV
jgi:hypothetical protein